MEEISKDLKELSKILNKELRLIFYSNENYQDGFIILDAGDNAIIDNDYMPFKSVKDALNYFKYKEKEVKEKKELSDRLAKGETIKGFFANDIITHVDCYLNYGNLNSAQGSYMNEYREEWEYFYEVTEEKLQQIKKILGA